MRRRRGGGREERGGGGGEERGGCVMMLIYWVVISLGSNKKKNSSFYSACSLEAAHLPCVSQEEELAGKTREVEQLTALVSSSKQMVESLERDLGTRESALRLVNLKLKDAESAQSRVRGMPELYLALNIHTAAAEFSVSPATML